MKKNYTEDLTNYNRRITHTVYIGDIPVGSELPLRIQSMANSSTADVKASVEQCISMIKAGAEFIRFTVPSVKDVDNLGMIRKELEDMRYNVPLIADVHFNPFIALLAAEVVSKVRINPGNYGTAGAETGDFALAEAEFRKLIAVCRENHTAIRIGVNQGSLSRRIVMKYGDSPRGMAESAMEFLRICLNEKFDQAVVSMKSSNVLVMVQSVRLLAAMMKEEGMTFPFHLGVTEAGEGEDGRIKSACGIGALLADGIGDTIRVSLTEDPAAELPVARKLADYFITVSEHEPLEKIKAFFDPYKQNKRPSDAVANTGGGNVPIVVASFDSPLTDGGQLEEFGWHYDAKGQTWKFDESAADYIFVPHIDIEASLPESKGVILPYAEWIRAGREGTWPLSDYPAIRHADADIHFISVTSSGFPEIIRELKEHANAVLVYRCTNTNVTGELRWLFSHLHASDCRVPVIIRRHYNEISKEDFQLKCAADIGCTLVDGFGNGLWITLSPVTHAYKSGDLREPSSPADAHKSGDLREQRTSTKLAQTSQAMARTSTFVPSSARIPETNNNHQDTDANVHVRDSTVNTSQDITSVPSTCPADVVRTTFAILQACRARIFKTEYISCPSCGRTHFDLIAAVAGIKARTSHLKGLKIGIMGCIVNGPGEMADADYGYVGAGKGRITLYKSREVLKRNIPEEEAVDALIDLIKQNGDWVEPE